MPHTGFAHAAAANRTETMEEEIIALKITRKEIKN